MASLTQCSDFIGGAIKPRDGVDLLLSHKEGMLSWGGPRTHDPMSGFFPSTPRPGSWREKGRDGEWGQEQRDKWC